MEASKEEPSTAPTPEEIDTDPLEEAIAKYGLFIMKLDQAISKLPVVTGYEPSRVILYDLRAMLAGHKRALRAELQQHRTPDS